MNLQSLINYLGVHIRVNIYKDLVIVIFAIITTLGVFVLVGLPLKFTIAVILITPALVFLATTQDKDKFFLAAFTLAISFTAARFFIGGLPPTFHPGGAQTHPAITLIDLLFILFGIFLVCRQETAIKTVRNSLFQGSAISLLLFIFWSAASIIPSEHPLLGIVSLLDIVKVSLVWLFFACYVRQTKDIKIVVRFLILGLVIQSLSGIYQAKFGFPAWAYPIVQGGDPTKIQELAEGSFLRVGGLFGYPTTFAQYLNLLIPLALCLFISASKTWETLVYGGSTLLAVIALIFTLSRAAWLALLMGAGVSVIALVCYGSARVRKRLLVTLFGVALVILCLTPLIMDRLSSPDEDAAINRLPMWKVGLNVIMHNPIFGTGLNSYSEIMHRYDPRGLISDFTFPPHNVYLFIAAEVGLPGVLFLLFFFSTIIVLLLRALKSPASQVTAISAGLLGGIITILFHALVDSSFKQELQLWYVLMGLCGLAIAVCRQGDKLGQA